jgi:acetyl esterase/lipase
MTRALDRVIDRILTVYRSWGRGTSVETMRSDWEAMLRPCLDGVTRQPAAADGVTGAWFDAPGGRRDRVILFFHGGGFRLGSVASHGELMARLALASGFRVLGIDYRLAPEHLFPAPLEDALAAYDFLLDEGFTPQQIVLMGDSAGGGIALSTLLAVRDEGRDLPAAAAVMSPWTDLAATGESYVTRAEADPIHQRQMILAIARAYLGAEGDPQDPRASPLYGDLRGLPPLLIQVGDRETVLDDARMFADKARTAGVAVTLDVADGMIHVFQLFADELPEARAAIAALAAFAQEHTGD